MRYGFNVSTEVGTDICTGELLPSLHRHPGKGTLPHAVEEKSTPALLTSYKKSRVSISFIRAFTRRATPRNACSKQKDKEGRTEVIDNSSVDRLPRSAAKIVVISSHSATTSGSFTSPPAWMRARISMASSTRPTFASQRGDLGRKGRPARRKTHGIN